MNTIEPAHIVMLRGALALHPRGTICTTLPAETRRKASLFARITRPVLELAETAQLPLGIVLLALGKGV